MRMIYLIGLLLITPVVSIAANNECADILKYYPYIKEIHKGPVAWNKDQSDLANLGVRYRAVIGVQEIYFLLIVEKFRAGDEGGMVYVSSQRLSVGPEKVVKFGKWLSPTSFSILINNKESVVSIDAAGKASFSK